MKTQAFIFGGCVITAGIVHQANADFVYSYAYGYAYSCENETEAYDSWLCD